MADAAPEDAWRSLLAPPRPLYLAILNLGVGAHAMDVFVTAAIIGSASAGLSKSMLGNRSCYTLAGCLFLAGALGAAMSQHLAPLLCARFVQGLGGGLLVALSYALISELFPPVLRPRALATIAATWGVAALAGPLLGGGFAELGYWRGAFLTGAGIVGSFTLAALWALPRGVGPGGGTLRLPWRRLALIGLGVLAVGVSGQFEATAPRLGLVALALLLVAGGFHLDAGKRVRLFPSRPLTLRHPVGTANWTILMFAISTTPIGVFMPLLAQAVHGLAPLAASYVQAALAIAWVATAFLTGHLRGPAMHAAIRLGPAIVLAGIAGAAWLAISGPMPALVACVALVGGGIGLSYAHVANLAMTAARPGEETVTASSLPMMQTLGIAFGAALAGLIANAGGLSAGVAPEFVGPAVRTVYLACLAAPVASGLLALHLTRLARARVHGGGAAG